jgi:hypothetical protein
MVVSPADLGKALHLARQFGAPTQLPARLLGLGADEPGVPTWAWIVIAFGAGAVVSVALGPKIRDFLEDHRIGR